MKKAFVTGSSRGIGRALALALAEDGYAVTVHCAGRLDKAEEVAEQIRQKGGTARVIRADLCDLTATETLARQIADTDVLVLNASLQYREAWQDIGVTHMEEQVHCNFTSSLRLIQAVAEHMKAQKWGRIITIGSVQEAKPHPDMLVYSATKAATANMVRSLSLQLAPYGITVNNVSPGVIYTDRNVEALSDPVYAAKVTATIPVGFYGVPEELNGLVKLLCGEEGRYITGQTIFVDGGKSVQ